MKVKLKYLFNFDPGIVSEQVLQVRTFITKMTNTEENAESNLPLSDQNANNIRRIFQEVSVNYVENLTLFSKKLAHISS